MNLHDTSPDGARENGPFGLRTILVRPNADSRGPALDP